MSLRNRVLKHVLKEAKAILKDRGDETYSIDSELLLMATLGFSKIQLITKDDYELSDKEIETFYNYIDKRANNMPVQYILGFCEFMGMKFEVNEYTLIPRPDTENVVELGIKHILQNKYTDVLDIGTGSGAIAISLAKFCKDISVTALDISQGALDMAIKNATTNGVLDRVEFLKSDLFECVNKKYDVIISNPPYINSAVIPTLDSQVKDYEPISALDGGDDGLKFYREIVEKSIYYIKTGGMLIFEIGYDQGISVPNIMREYGYKDIEVIKDLAGLDRGVAGYLYNCN